MSVEHFEPLPEAMVRRASSTASGRLFASPPIFRSSARLAVTKACCASVPFTRQDRFRNEGVVCRGAAFDFFNGIEALCPVGRCERAALDRTVFLQFCNFGRAVDSSLIETAAMYNVGTLNAEKTQSLCDCFEKIWRINADQRIVWVSGIGERPQNVEDRAGFKAARTGPAKRMAGW